MTADWDSREQIETLQNHLKLHGFRNLRISISGDGETAVAIWECTCLTERKEPWHYLIHLCISRDAASTWGPVKILPSQVNIGYNPAIAISKNGNHMVAAWLQPLGRSLRYMDRDAGHLGVVSATSTDFGSNWSDPELVSPVDSDGSVVTCRLPTPKILDSKGNAIVAWRQRNAVGLRRFDAELQTWEELSLLPRGGGVSPAGSSINLELKSSQMGSLAIAKWRRGWRNFDKDSVRLAVSEDGGKSWHVAQDLPPASRVHLLRQRRSLVWTQVSKSSDMYELRFAVSHDAGWSFTSCHRIVSNAARPEPAHSEADRTVNPPVDGPYRFTRIQIADTVSGHIYLAWGDRVIYFLKSEDGGVSWSGLPTCMETESNSTVVFHIAFSDSCVTVFWRDSQGDWYSQLEDDLWVTKEMTSGKRYVRDIQLPLRKQHRFSARQDGPDGHFDLDGYLPNQWC